METAPNKQASKQPKEASKNPKHTQASTKQASKQACARKHMDMTSAISRQITSAIS